MAEVELKELEEEELVPEENDLIFVELGDVQAVKTTLDDSLVQVRGTFHWDTGIDIVRIKDKNSLSRRVSQPRRR